VCDFAVMVVRTAERDVLGRDPPGVCSRHQVCVVLTCSYSSCSGFECRACAHAKIETSGCTHCFSEDACPAGWALFLGTSHVTVNLWDSNLYKLTDLVTGICGNA
jgi:hypothetical protein